MEFKLLEPITYSRNSSNPQFTPFNYIVEDNSYKFDSDITAIFLSQLPVIFKKYNIPLYNNDLFLWLDPKDSVADIWDFKDIFNHYKTGTKEEKREIEFIQEFFTFFKKISFSNKDKMIEELINKRYNYYYNRNDKYAYFKFKKFLNDSIQDGFISYNDIDLEQDFTMSKKEQIEQEIRNHFYYIKVVFKDKPVVFLSERYHKVYECLAMKYPEIEFLICYSAEEYRNLHRKLDAVFVNDMNYELIPKMKIRNYVPHLNFAPIKYRQLSKEFISNNLPIHPVVPPYLQTDVSLKEQIKIYYGKKYLKCRYVSDITEVIDYLEAEREILMNNGILSTIELLPDAFQEYFTFCMENECVISYLKSQIDFNHLPPELKKKILKDLLNYFDISKVSEKLILIFMASNESTPIWRQESIKKEHCYSKVKILKAKNSSL